MTAKQYCKNNQAIGYASCLGGVEVHGIEYGIDDYVYAVSGAWCNKKSYHRVKIYYGNNDRSYFRVNGIRVYFDEIIKINQ